jgi:GAF domain-containing protein
MTHPSEGSGLQRALLEILDEAMQLDGAAFGKIRVARPADRTLEIEVHRGLSDGFVQAFRAVTPEDTCPSARAARTGKRIAVPDITRQPTDDPFLTAVRDEGVRGMQATPIVNHDGRVLGTLSTLFRSAYAASTVSALVLDHLARRAASLIGVIGPA